MALKPESATRKDRRTGKAEMQHRHFATVACIIAKLPRAERQRMAEHFANELSDTNLRFDRRRFLAACEVVT